jgi:uncharacterized protein with ParB-like and HNH nuclease domain
MKLLEADTKNLEYLLSLSYGTLNIPYSQRPYEWGEEQVLRLFNDFYSVYANSESNHVLNFITVRIDEDDNNTKYIFDGQQRTVTSLMIIAALVNELKRLDPDDVRSADRLTSLYLFTTHWKDTNATNYKIEFENEDANKMLHEHIFKGEDIPANHVFTDYDFALYKNYNDIVGLLNTKFNDDVTKEQLLEFVEAILERVLVVIIETSYENIAEEMFETLNSTGLQLEDFYVIKNTLVRTLGEDTVKPFWSTIEINTDRINKGKFLNTYVNTINGKTPSNHLYNRIARIKDLETKESALEFIVELKKTSDIFLKIEKPSQRIDGTSEENLKYSRCISTLTLLNANQYKPVIIAMGLKDFPIGEVNIVLNKIISLQLRNIFISDLNANTLELFYPKLAKEIYMGEHTTVNEIVAKISDEIVSDTQLYDSFNNKVIRSSKDESIIRFILKEIFGQQHPEISINNNSREVNLEHILPKMPANGSQWLVDFADDEQRFISTRKIGNLTVLYGRLNSSIKNSDFTIKKEVYNTSAIPQNKDLATQIEWKLPQIDQRTIALYEQFIRIWTKE